MEPLAKLLADHGPLLVLDAASTRIQTGLLRGGSAPLWESPPGDAGTALFAGTDTVLRAASLGIGDVGAFVFCEGPGSMLGIRTVAMAIRTWTAVRARPAFAYNSLAVAGVREAKHRAAGGFAMIADARRDTWHCLEISRDGGPGPMRRVATAELPAGELVTPGDFRAWTQPPRTPTTCSYDLATIFAEIGDGPFFRPTDAPDAFQHEAPVYKQWTSQVHSAATAGAR